MRHLAFLTYLLLFLGLLAGAAAAGWYFAVRVAPKDDHRKYTCSMHPLVRNDGPGICPMCQMELVPLDTLPPSKDGSLTIDPVVVQNLGIRVHELARGPLVRTLAAFGSLRLAEPSVREVSLKTRGWIETLAADTEGMRIAAGDLLFAVYSPELVLAQEELIAAKKGSDASLLAAARAKLALLDVDAAQIREIESSSSARRTLDFRAPLGGTLIQKSIVAGAAVEAAVPLLRIADLSTLWLDAQVYEHQLADVKAGAALTATFDGLPGETVGGKVVFVAPTVDPETRTAVVRVALANPDGRLRPGMFARVHAPTVLAEDALLVPREAVLDSGKRQVAFVALGKGRFAPRTLSLGRSGDDGNVEVLAGLAAGELVVTSGHFLLDAESRLREATQKLSEDGMLASRPTIEKRVPQIALTAAERDNVDAFLLAYLALCERMAADAWDEAKATALDAAARTLPEPALAAHRAALVSALAGVKSGELAARRKAFVAVSDAAIALVSAAAPSPKVGKEVLVVHCPMVPASWLQLREPIANPYEGSNMLTCGEVTSRIPTHSESPR